MTAPVRAWPPSRWTPPLSDDFPTDGDWLLELVDLAYRLPSGEPLVLDEWQRQLIRHVLERYPEGHPRAGELRFRQALISVARQSGKSVLGAIFALYGLVRESGALVIGLASTAEQARIIQHRLLAAVRGHPSLARRFKRITDTRGVESTDGSRYEVKASKSAAVQGLDVSLGLVDELHITPKALWVDLVNGSRARRNGLVLGVTTAGDEDSELLKWLYETAGNGSGGERFGFWIWEAPTASVPEDDGELARWLQQACPPLAAGRLDLEQSVRDARMLPPTDVVRYLGNRFVAASAAFISADKWLATARPAGESFPAGRPVFAVDQTPGQGYATITANLKVDKVTHTEVVASVVNPRFEQLLDICVRLARHSPAQYIVDGYALRDLGNELRRRGLEVRIATQGDVVNASSLLYAKVMRRELQHGGDPLLSVQMPRTVRKNIGDSFRISKRDSSVEIDAVMATALGVYAAEVVSVVPAQQIF